MKWLNRNCKVGVPLNNNPLLIHQSPVYEVFWPRYVHITPVPDVWPLGLAPRDDEDPGVGHHPDWNKHYCSFTATTRGVPLFNKSHVIERPSVKETSFWHPRTLAFFPLENWWVWCPFLHEFGSCNLRTRADGTDCMKTTCKWRNRINASDGLICIKCVATST